MNSNAATIIDLARLEILNTVLLDNIDRGAADPWGVAWSADSATLVITHAGTHEISVMDFPAVLARLARLPATLDSSKPADPSSASRVPADVPNDLAFLVGVRQRIKLPPTDLGPRAVVVLGRKAYVANYFSDSLSLVDLTSPQPKPRSIPLLLPPAGAGGKGLQSPTRPHAPRSQRASSISMTPTICFQGWQSCASCHDDDARVDGLNWDLLNDGIGNPKDTKSLVLSHQTPPVMSMGVRATAEIGGPERHPNSSFTVQPEAVPAAMDEWLKSLKPAPSPLPGEWAGCPTRPGAARSCSRIPASAAPTATRRSLFTDLQSYNVGTQNPFDKEDRSSTRRRCASFGARRPICTTARRPRSATC